MKRTNTITLILLTAIGGVGAGLLETVLTARGRPILLPPLTLGLALLAIGGIVVLLALPIRRLTRGTGQQPIDPYYSTRVLVLAKASALSGSLLAGFGVGVAIYLLSRSVVPLGSVGLAVAMLIGAGGLLAGGLIAEHMCTIPPDDDDEDDGKRPIRVQP